MKIDDLIDDENIENLIDRIFKTELANYKNHLVCIHKPGLKSDVIEHLKVNEDLKNLFDQVNAERPNSVTSNVSTASNVARAGGFLSGYFFQGLYLTASFSYATPFCYTGMIVGKALDYFVPYNPAADSLKECIMMKAENYIIKAAWEQIYENINSSRHIPEQNKSQGNNNQLHR